jgi:HupE/UreJ protein
MITGRKAGAECSAGPSDCFHRVRGRSAIALVICAGLLAAPADAHDVAQDIPIRAFVKLEPKELHLVLRVPLGLLEGVEFPTKGNTDIIDLAAARAATERALTIVSDSVALWEGDARMRPAFGKAHLSLPSDRSFDRYDTAVPYVAEPVAPDTEIYRTQGYLDAHLTYRSRSSPGVFAIQVMSAPERRAWTLEVQWLPRHEPARTLRVTRQSALVVLNPAWHQAARDFVARGIRQIVTGSEQLLFLLCVILPFRRTRDITPIAAVFVTGHLIALVGVTSAVVSAGAWLSALIGTGVAASIAYMAVRNVVSASPSIGWRLAGLFGLVHGLGLSYPLNEQLPFAASHQLVSVLSFALGLAIGEFGALAVMLAGVRLVLRSATSERMVVVVLSAIIGHTGWRSAVERGGVLWQADWPRVDGPALLMLAQWLAIILIAVGTVSSVVRWIEHARRHGSDRGRLVSRLRSSLSHRGR